MGREEGWREGDPSPHTQIHMLWHRSECLPPPSSLLASQLARFTAFDQHGLSFLPVTPCVGGGGQVHAAGGSGEGGGRMCVKP